MRNENEYDWPADVMHCTSQYVWEWLCKVLWLVAFNNETDNPSCRSKNAEYLCASRLLNEFLPLLPLLEKRARCLRRWTETRTGWWTSPPWQILLPVCPIAWSSSGTTWKMTWVKTSNTGYIVQLGWQCTHYMYSTCMHESDLTCK